MQTERQTKQKTLEDLAESTISRDDAKKLRDGLVEILEVHGVDGHGSLVFGARTRIFRSSVKVGKKEIKVGIVSVYNSFLKPRDLEGKLKENQIDFDIGMVTTEGERVRLELQPNGFSSWHFKNRSYVGQGIGGETPSNSDIQLNLQVLEKLQEQLAKK
ncbi:hypothetical protein HY502_00890 [Candidatus Woesebacteria bacterium]|nr:hypothetical protein [Candidatus Woesebacteria bacterium]